MFINNLFDDGSNTNDVAIDLIKEIEIYNKFIGGYLLFINNYSDFNLTMILNYKNLITKSIPKEYLKILFGNGNPSNYNILNNVS